MIMGKTMPPRDLDEDDAEEEEKPTNRRSCASRTKTRARCPTQKAAKVSLGGLCRCVAFA